MCRHAAWLGAERPLASLIDEPEHGLLKQSYAPRRQRHGLINADGYGMGWYVSGRHEPVRYRRSVPIWTDANLPGLAATARSTCLLAAVRSATVGMPVEESATAPFTDGAWLLSHNGRVVRDAVRDLCDGAESTCDAAWVAAAVFQRGRAGADLGEALSEVVVRAGEKDPAARLNLLAADGTTIVATVWGDTLFHHRTHDGVLVASEPLDDLPGWQAVPERSLLTVTRDDIAVQPL
ncbi:ergothioneine biosynthesis protein EgtC [Nonomuraea gerenzanensis]|uniref:Gamma-glutamyl-hercynylcysteine sulfoxide hydrolase n=1 Tax=Nonomuraea gerenzanensis TaxID=93944 RepID=A0A1M4E586_9ACTN|nr:ergothioneine biosynthesis protein EgtC [Nonomuraea gerenzanensis]UBU16135.1 ergothioneine biosynthesis protein EgtC [Nonomuraea gerenzanensis]SBO93942.1 Glutamine amidotransferases class-II [Nonomuraea gerenzanensis]